MAAIFSNTIRHSNGIAASDMQVCRMSQGFASQCGYGKFHDEVVLIRGKLEFRIGLA
jgi:hypothetical protein